MIRAPAFSVIASMRPSVESGTPEIICFGGSPRRLGQLRRTMSWLAPMPPLVTITAAASSAKSPAAVRELGTPRGTDDGSSTVPLTPVTAPSLTTSSSTWWRKRSCTSPCCSAARTRRMNGASTPGPVPQVR